MLQWCPSNCQPHGTVYGGLAKNADPVIELAEFLGQPGEFGEMRVQPHRVAGGFKGAHPQAGTQNAKSEFTLLFAQICEAKSMTHQIAMDIAPGPPNLAIDIEADRRALLWIKRIQERTRLHRLKAEPMRRWCVSETIRVRFHGLRPGL